MSFKPEDMAFVPEPATPPSGGSGVSESHPNHVAMYLRRITDLEAQLEAKKHSRPDQFDHELGMLYNLKNNFQIKLQDTYYRIVEAGPVARLLDSEGPGLRRALEIVTAEIKLRTRP